MPDQSPDLHPLLSRRWSPLRFDHSHSLSADEVALLLQAARWAPSAGNSQPWAFVVGRRGDDVHRRLSARLAPSARRWAPTAALLVANLSHRLVESTGWEFSEFALYDLGQAVAHLTLQAQAMGLAIRQFRAFDRDGIAVDFGVPAHGEVTSMAAVGRPHPRTSRRRATLPRVRGGASRRSCGCRSTPVRSQSGSAAARSRFPSTCIAARTSCEPTSRKGTGRLPSSTAYQSGSSVVATSRVVAASTASSLPRLRGSQCAHRSSGASISTSTS
ncbi:MAG: nitroreductase family protein [Nocardioides sp.]|nr:nitroreductase family protein [Nocardioides sp.]